MCHVVIPVITAVPVCAAAGDDDGHHGNDDAVSVSRTISAMSPGHISSRSATTAPAGMTLS